MVAVTIRPLGLLNHAGLSYSIRSSS